tara:strand:- start:7418 stop:7594 length:177 start_codon:yes stop_codon:yes gene_type:complete
MAVLIDQDIIDTAIKIEIFEGEIALIRQVFSTLLYRKHKVFYITIPFRRSNWKYLLNT